VAPATPLGPRLEESQARPSRTAEDIARYPTTQPATGPNRARAGRSSVSFPAPRPAGCLRWRERRLLVGRCVSCGVS